MSLTVLLTGFGPFPGAPFNPTGPLVRALARRRGGAGVRRLAHVFPTSYEAVDRELPALIARERPDLVVMFGLAQRIRHLRLEILARNVRSRRHADAAGRRPAESTIVPGGPATLALRAPAQRLAAAARRAGLAAALSRDAGSYLCNYLCWRACEIALKPRGPRLVAFVHVPAVANGPRPPKLPRRRVASRRRRAPRTLGDLLTAGEAIIGAALAAARAGR